MAVHITSDITEHQAHLWCKLQCTHAYYAVLLQCIPASFNISLIFSTWSDSIQI